MTSEPLMSLRPEWQTRRIVKLLFVENLSCKLVARLAELYPGFSTRQILDLLARSDLDIWEFALREAS